MSECLPKIKNTCGEALYAACVYYEGTIPSISDLTEGDCYSVQEVIEDLYSISVYISESIDLTVLEGNELTYRRDAENKIIVRTAIETHADEIISLKEKVLALESDFDGDLDITTWGLNTDCLVDACDEEFTSLKQLLQAMITQICANVVV